MSGEVNHHSGDGPIARFGPCDPRDPQWPFKMSALTGSPGSTGSTGTTGNTKKRKKTESRTQTALNKCVNEKRRREKESSYIDELSKLITASTADMNTLSVKPDKSAILQETVNKLRTITEQTERYGAVQQGEVSSSKPKSATIRNQLFAKLVLEAIEGFLFIVNLEGKVEDVTENVAQFIHYSRDEVLGKSIFNFMHHGDHNRFFANFSSGVGWNNDSTCHPTGRNRSFPCRLLVKPPDDQDETMEEKQQRQSEYQNMLIASSVLPNNQSGDVSESADSGQFLMCLARRVPQGEKSLLTPGERFTVRMDTSGKLISIDTVGLSSNYKSYLNESLVGRRWYDLCHPSDRDKVSVHFKDSLRSEQPPQMKYRLRVGANAPGPEKYLWVQAQSKFFKQSPLCNDPDFVMATHSIIGEETGDNNAGTGTGGTSPQSVPSICPSSSGSPGSSVGGPLMSSAPVNGQVQRPGPGAYQSPGSADPLNANSSFSSLGFNPPDLFNEFFPTSSTWELPGETGATTPQTPRPPSTSAAPSPFSGTYPFSPAQEESKDTKDGIVESATSGNSSNESARLRNLLTKPSSGEDGDGGQDDEVHNKDPILKGLLNQGDEEDRSRMGSLSAQPREQPKTNNMMLLKLLNEKNDDEESLEARVGIKNQGELLQRLIKDVEERKPSEREDSSLLTNLGLVLPSPPPGLSGGHGSTGATRGPNSMGGPRKRPSDESDSDFHGPKRPGSVPGALGAPEHVSSSGPMPSGSAGGPGNGPGSGPGTPVPAGSKLCERNKMLAHLLAKPPSQPVGIVHVPASEISATPQDKLRVDRHRTPPAVWAAGPSLQSPSSSTASNSQPRLPPGPEVRPRQAQVRHNMMVNHQDAQQQMHNQQLQKAQMQQQQQQWTGSGPGPGSGPGGGPGQGPNSVTGPNPVTSSGTGAAPGGDNASLWDSHSSDPYLSDLLDQVIDIVPDASVDATTSGLLEGYLPSPAPIQAPAPPPTGNSSFTERDKIAINAITQSLMQCETAVSPSSPTIGSAPPAYNSVSTQQGGFTPPPMYQQRPPRFTMQQQSQVQQVQQAQQQNALGVRSAAPQYGIGNSPLTNQAILQRSKLIQQQQQQQAKQHAQNQERNRLLQQQQQQQLLIPSNATAEQLQPGLQNIDSLLNSTVAPNVSLQRSSSIPDSQLSPSYGTPLQPGAGPRLAQPYSPHSQQQPPGFPSVSFSNSQGPGQVGPVPVGQGVGPPVGAQPNVQAAQARLSPLPASSLPSFQQSQLSPRISQVQQPGYPNMQQGPYGAPNRMFVNQPRTPQQQVQQQQQQQLTQQHLQQQQMQQAGQMGMRSMPSPGTPGSTRQSPFTPDGFQAPSPPANASYYQMQRLQRTMSAPSATTQLPGSQWHYMKDHPEPTHMPHHPLHHPHPSHPFHHVSPHHMMYPPSPHPSASSAPGPTPDSQFCYDQTSLQMYGSSDRGRPGPTSQPPCAGAGAGAGNNNMASDYVKQELRATVGARMQQQGSPRTPQQHMGMSMQQPDLSNLGMNYESPSSGSSDASKPWSLGPELGAVSPQPSLARNNMEDPSRSGGDQKTSASLLQKLLSEH